MKNVLVIGSTGQIGSELTMKLRKTYRHGRIYKRNYIQISFLVKKVLSPDAADATIKINFTGHESLPEIRDNSCQAAEARSGVHHPGIRHQERPRCRLPGHSPAFDAR